VTARGKREEAPEEDAVTVLGVRPIHQRCSWWWQWRRRRWKRETSSPVAIVRFAPTTTEEEC
jgi:hypothetical protein